MGTPVKSIFWGCVCIVWYVSYCCGLKGKIQKRSFLPSEEQNGDDCGLRECE